VRIAEITFDLDTVLWLGVPPIASIAVLIAGLRVRRHSPGMGFVLVIVGLAALIASAAWIALVFYVDTVLGDT
jgi:hypothetical protein